MAVHFDRKKEGGPSHDSSSEKGGNFENRRRHKGQKKRKETRGCITLRQKKKGFCWSFLGVKEGKFEHLRSRN